MICFVGFVKMDPLRIETSGQRKKLFGPSDHIRLPVSPNFGKDMRTHRDKKRPDHGKFMVYEVTDIQPVTGIMVVAGHSNLLTCKQL